MTMTKLFAVSALSLAASAGAAFAADCGDVTIAEMNWASASLMANVDAIILEEGYGCNVELITGDTTPTFTSMNEKGQPDVAPELWINAVATPLAAAKEAGSLVALNDGPITGLGEGWWVTKKFKEDHPDLDTVEKLLDHPELFPYIEDESKGAFMGCPAGWGCQSINANQFRAFDMEAKGWVLVDPGSPPVLTDLSRKRSSVTNRGLGTTGAQRPLSANTSFRCCRSKRNTPATTTGTTVFPCPSKTALTHRRLHGLNPRLNLL